MQEKYTLEEYHNRQWITLSIYGKKKTAVSAFKYVQDKCPLSFFRVREEKIIKITKGKV
jgi:hypothetical protein